MSLGYAGVSYPVLARYIGAYRGLRAMARAGIFVVMFLAILTAYGYAMAVRTTRPLARAVFCVFLVAGMIAEYATTFVVTDFPSTPPSVYRVLAHQPRGVVAEVPIAVPGEASEGRSAYLSTFYWFPLVNGYSGNFPPSYLARVDRMHDFPEVRAFYQMRYDRVTYLIVHEWAYNGPRLEDIHAAMAESGAADLGQYDDGLGKARLYRIR
jgi:hypothetical protein